MLFSHAMKKIDFAKLPTEKPNPRSKKIDILPVERILTIINKEDTSVPKAVKKVKPQIAQAVSITVNALKNKGKLYFAGAGTSGRL